MARFDLNQAVGNLLATPEGDLAYLDYGMMSEAPPRARFALIAHIVHLVNRDYQVRLSAPGQSGHMSYAPVHVTALSCHLPWSLTPSAQQFHGAHKPQGSAADRFQCAGPMIRWSQDVQSGKHTHIWILLSEPLIDVADCCLKAAKMAIGLS